MLSNCAPLASTASRRVVSLVRASFVFSSVRVRTKYPLRTRAAISSRRPLVLFSERAIRLTRFSVGKDNAPAKRRVTLKIHRPNRPLVHQKRNFASCRRQCRPIIMQHRLFQRLMLAPHLVRSDQFVCREHRPDLRIQRIKDGRGKLLRHGCMILSRQVRLGFEQNINRHMAGMRQRPRTNNL